MKHYNTISGLHNANGYAPPERAMFSILTCQDTICSIGESEFTSDFYIIGFKKLISGKFSYGRTKYDHDNGTMSFIKPRQIVEMSNLEVDETAYMMFIHEDFLVGHHLHAEIKKYGFFNYETNEALHLSAKEEKIICDLFLKIESEYETNQDEYSKDIILTYLDSILKYSQRFYKRQFIDRAVISGTTISKFTEILTSYFESGLVHQQGLPTVQYVASKLNISPRYLSDMLKQETGKTALDHIHIFLIAEAKDLLRKPDHTIAETAYSLGFENPPYFSRLFKKEVGVSPNQYKETFLLQDSHTAISTN
jgi:AraC-like DNA-binding protein